ncbi:hypothetical protein ACFQ4K_19955 [Tistrella bauzanensis]
MTNATIPPAATSLHPLAPPIVADSVTRLGPEAEGAVLVAASHGGAYAAYLAAMSRVRGVILNDAGIGLDRAGLAGLDLAQKIGLAAATISHDSARIGNGQDMLARGVISQVNVAAIAMGVEPGQSCAEAAARLAAAPALRPAGALCRSAPGAATPRPPRPPHRADRQRRPGEAGRGCGPGGRDRQPWRPDRRRQLERDQDRRLRRRL